MENKKENLKEEKTLKKETYEKPKLTKHGKIKDVVMFTGNTGGI